MRPHHLSAFQIAFQDDFEAPDFFRHLTHNLYTVLITTIAFRQDKISNSFRFHGIQSRFMFAVLVDSFQMVSWKLRVAIFGEFI